MSMQLNYLWQNLYKVVDQVIDTGEPVTIERNGIKLNLVLSNVEEVKTNIHDQNTTSSSHSITQNKKKSLETSQV